MFNQHLIRCLVGLFVLFLFAIGYHFYNNHVKFRDLMSGHLEFQKTFLDIEGTQDSLDNSDRVTNNRSTALAGKHWSTYDKRDWSTYWSNYGPPVEVRYAEVTSIDEINPEVVTTSYPDPPIIYEAKDFVPQLVKTPDGQVHKMYWFEKLRPGQPVPPPEVWPIMLQVTVDGVTYDVPEGETSDSYIDKIHLSSMYDVPLEDVDRLIEEEVIPNSAIEAQYDPLLVPGGKNSATEIRGFEDTDTVSERNFPVDTEGTFSPSNLPDMVKPTPSPQSVVDIENQLTPQGIEAELTKGLSPERFDKAQQFIDQYGTEEGLRRLRESDPEAARRFERERRDAPERDAPKDDGYSDDQPPDDSP